MRTILRRLYNRLPEQSKPIVRGAYKTIVGFIGRPRLMVAWGFMSGGRIDDINAFEQRIYSQNGEDGIIKIIFHKIGHANKFCVEFGVFDGSECNTRYLIEKHGWHYLHMDGGDYKRLYTDVKKEFITAENINLLFRKYNVPEEFDLLSIDIDFNDYWVWKAIEGYRPRAVVIEYNSSIPPTESKAVKYEPYGRSYGTDYFGASLLAFARLGELKGYALLGCDKTGTNAFFVRSDLVGDHFTIKDIKEVYRPPAYGQIVNGKFIGHPPSDKPFVTV